MGLLKTYFTYIQNPVEGMHQFMLRRSFRQACLGYWVSALSWVLFFNIGDHLSIPVFCLKMMIIFMAEITLGYFVAALCGLFLDLIRVRVSSAQLFVMIGSTGIIKSLLIAFALISAAVPGFHLGWFAPLVLLGVWVLQLLSLVCALQQTWGVDPLESLGGWLFGFIPVGVLFTLAGIFLIWFLVLLF